MKLYYMPGACSLATHIVLEWIGVPYETHRLSHADLKKPDYLKVNPMGAVPSLALDGWVLTQNTAILNYLADSYPAAKLGGDGTPAGRAEVNRWLGFVCSDMHPAFKPLFGATAYLEDAAAVEKTKVYARETIQRMFRTANSQLQGHDWIAGTRSITDPYLYVMARWARVQKIDISDCPAVERFFEKMQADAGVARALAAEGLS